MQFSEIPGLQTEKEILIRSVQDAHLAHAQLFLGKPGSANLALAMAFATYLNCENPSETDSCGTCSACTKNAKAIHPDVQFVFPIANIAKDMMSHNYLPQWREFLKNSIYGDINTWNAVFGAQDKQFNIARAESYQITSNLSMKAYEGGYKILILWLPEYLHSSTANALLKILEEPPEKTIFLLVSTNLEKVLGTIQSRTQIFRIPAFSDQDVAHYLHSNMEVPQDKANDLAIMADGSISQALSLLEEGNEVATDFFIDWMRHCWEADFIALNQDMELFHKMGKESQKNLFNYGLYIFRESLLGNFSINSLQKSMGELNSFVQKFSAQMNLEKIQFLSDLFNEAHYHIERNAYAKLVFMDTSIDIAKTIRKK
ncbi:ATP-binding protein [Fulvivirgaceae bacterium LMO-SS25]